MSDVKKPQDHLSKTVKPKVEMVDGGRQVTLRGVTVTVTDDALDDFELLEDLDALQRDKKSAGRLPSVFRRLVGDAEYDTVMGALRGENGRVSVEVAAAFVMELFEALDPNS